jgi:hypothetical protein
MDMSRKLMLLLSSSSMMNLIVGDMSLDSWSSMCMSVVLGLNNIRISSTYLKYPSIWWCFKMLNICVSSRYCKCISENMEEVGAPVVNPLFYKWVVFWCLK